MGLVRYLRTKMAVVWCIKNPAHNEFIETIYPPGANFNVHMKLLFELKTMRKMATRLMADHSDLCFFLLAMAKMPAHNFYLLSYAICDCKWLGELDEVGRSEIRVLAQKSWSNSYASERYDCIIQGDDGYVLELTARPGAVWSTTQLDEPNASFDTPTPTPPSPEPLDVGMPSRLFSGILCPTCGDHMEFCDCGRS